MSGPPPFSYRPLGMPGMPSMMPPRPYGFVPPPPMGMMPSRPGGFMPSGPPVMPGPYSMAPPRPMMPPPRVAKATTVYVGKIAATVEDRVIQQLLEACGSIKSWKLMKDPDSNAHKGFGFCDFHDAEGVLRAVRLLNGLSVDGQELLIKPNSATDSYLEQYQRDKEQRAMERAEARVLKAIRQEDEKKRAQQQQEQQQQQAKEEQQAPDPMAVDGEVKQEEGQQPGATANGQQAAGKQEGEHEQLSGSAADVEHEDGAAAPCSNGDAAVKQEVKEDSAPESSTPCLPQLQPPPKPKPLLPVDDELEEGEDPLAAEKAADEKALAAIHAIVKPRDAVQAANAEATNEVLAAAGLVLLSPPGQGPSPGPYADGAVASVPERGHSAERGKDTGRERSRDRSGGRDSGHGSRGRSRRDGAADVPPEVAERKLAEAFDADRERAKREEEAKKRADDARYERKLRELESRERQLARELERDKERQRDAAKERERHMRADLEAVESDDEVEPWQRRPLRHSRRSEERRKRRMWEERDDAEDRAKDDAAAREAARQQEQQGQQQQQEEQDGHERSSKRARVEGQQAGTPPPQQPEEAVQQAAAFNSAPHVPDDDPIYRAMVAAAQQPASQPSPAADLQPAAPPQQPLQQQQQPQQRGSRLAPAGGRPKKAVLALFGDEEEGEQKRRKLVPIQYTEEELRAVQEPEPATAQEASAAAAPAAAATAEDGKAVLRRIMDSIPVSREGVHEYPLKWDTWDGTGTAAAAAAGAGGGVRSKVSKWVSKKVADLLGAEEPDLVAFIMALLDSRSTPQKVEDEVSAILDNEAASFTMKLYRLLIYETEKAALGLP